MSSLNTTSEKRVWKIGDIEVPVVEAARLKEYNFVTNIFHGAKSLLTGMGITFSYFRKPSTIVTQQYPENRKTLKMFDRMRAELVFIYDENGYHKCTSCKLCEKACPNTSIMVHTRRGEASGRKELDRYVYRLDSCTFCNACVLVCPTGAIEMKNTFENSVYDRRLLVYLLNSYAGPQGPILLKEEDEAKRKSMMDSRRPYEVPAILPDLKLSGVIDPSKTDASKNENQIDFGSAREDIYGD